MAFSSIFLLFGASVCSRTTQQLWEFSSSLFPKTAMGIFEVRSKVKKMQNV